MKIIIYLFFLLFVLLVSVIPFWLIYRLSDLLFFVFYYLIGYRKKVVYQNLKNSFTEKSEEEIRLIAKDFYRNLCDILVEGLKGFGISKASVVKRYKLLNPEILNAYYNKGLSMIGVTAHYCNWEWGTLAGGLQVRSKVITFFMPLSNQYIDMFLKKSREACGTTLEAAHKASRVFENNKNNPVIYLMVADQSPSNYNKVYWLNFLNQETACMPGVERYAKHYNIPVFFIDIKRIKRGYYEFSVKIITENPNDFKDGELTVKYMKLIEEKIKKDPANWLWSHRRWKKKKSELVI